MPDVLIYRITFVDTNVEMTGKEYAMCFVLLGLAGTFLLYVTAEPIKVP
jgi:K+-transporting ATPase A subunit